VTKTRIAIVSTALAIVPVEAHAYLDPGTGSLILQGLMAAFFAAAFTFKLWWYRLKSIFMGASPGPAPERPTEEPAEHAET
jgi:hypothetical protein